MSARDARLVCASSITGPTCVVGTMTVTFIHGSRISTIVPGSGRSAGLSMATSAPFCVITRYSTGGDRLEAGRDVTGLPRLEARDGPRVGNENAELEQFALLLGREKADAVVRGERAIDDADVRDHALVRVVVRVEDERAEGRV